VKKGRSSFPVLTNTVHRQMAWFSTVSRVSRVGLSRVSRVRIRVRVRFSFSGANL